MKLSVCLLRIWRGHIRPRVPLLLAPTSLLLGPSPVASALLAAGCTASMTTGHLWATDLNLTYIPALARRGRRRHTDGTYCAPVFQVREMA